MFLYDGGAPHLENYSVSKDSKLNPSMQSHFGYKLLRLLSGLPLKRDCSPKRDKVVWPFFLPARG